MKMLFLGGTAFVGRHIALAAIAAGHEVTFFHRGVTNTATLEDHEHLIGDRYGDVSVLRTRSFDVVVDTSGYAPDAVRATASALAGRIGTYYFMSSVDVYADPSVGIVDETALTKALPPEAPTGRQVSEFYGAQKVRCKQEIDTIIGSGQVIVVRAGLMVGPNDNTDRFTYWPVRIARGGEILAPVGPDLPMQVIDVRDVARWSITMLARGAHGIFNLVGMPETLSLGALFNTAAAVAGVTPKITFVSSEFLAERNVGAWVELPLWIPDIAWLAGFCKIRNDRALATGLTLRPLAQTVADILAEYRERPADAPLRAGLEPDREAELLTAWHESGR